MISASFVRSSRAVHPVVRPRASAIAAVVLLLSAAFAGCGGSSSPAPTPLPNVPFSQTDIVVGTGADAVNGKTLTVNYTGWLYDATKAEQKGTQVDTTTGRGPYSFVLGAGSVIPGWDQGIPGMKVGGKRRLVIPPELAYGASGRGQIPPNAALVFDVELLAVQ
jgi:FKBP-type peptidyl-prolyl cis-trans isomerase FkpA